MLLLRRRRRAVLMLLGRRAEGLVLGRGGAQRLIVSRQTRGRPAGSVRRGLRGRVAVLGGRLGGHGSLRERVVGMLLRLLLLLLLLNAWLRGRGRVGRLIGSLWIHDHGSLFFHLLLLFHKA